jgi:3'(2'), 5'-bisphosphate nucleotidase
MSHSAYDPLLEKAIEIILRAGQEVRSIYDSDQFEVELKADRSPLTRADRVSHQVITRELKTTNLPILSEESRRIDWNVRSGWARFWMVDPLDGTKEFIKRNGEFTINIALIDGQRPVMGIIYAPVREVLYFGVQGKGAFKLGDRASEKSLSSIPGWKNEAIKLPVSETFSVVRAVVSRSHLSEETRDYIQNLEHDFGSVQPISAGSALKLCVIAEGNAEIYPRMGPTMEWDIAAGDIIVSESGGNLLRTDGSVLLYNKKDLRNPWFVAQSRAFVKHTGAL